MLIYIMKKREDSLQEFQAGVSKRIYKSSLGAFKSYFTFPLFHRATSPISLWHTLRMTKIALLNIGALILSTAV